MIKVIVYLKLFLDLPTFHPIVTSSVLPFQICDHKSQIKLYTYFVYIAIFPKLVFMFLFESRSIAWS